MALRDRTELLVLAGSRAHGTAREGSDVDAAGVALPTRQQLLGLTPAFEQVNTDEALEAYVPDLLANERQIAARTKLEGTIYSVRKFLRLASAANPGILEVLFARDEEVRRVSELGALLLGARRLFLSERCRHTFGGYASSQLGRIRLHHRWHHDGPEGPPKRCDFGLPEQTLIPRNQLEAAEAAIRQQIDRWELDLSGLEPATRIDVMGRVARTLTEWNLAGDAERHAAAARWIGLDDNVIELMQHERRWRVARDEWRRYKVWRTHRNPERAALESRHGYDTKHGAHLVRLLRMGVEVVGTGQLAVWRGDRDAEELVAIRDGAWSYDQLLEWAETTQRALADTRSVLPPAPDTAAIDALCITLHQASLEAE